MARRNARRTGTSSTQAARFSRRSDSDQRSCNHEHLLHLIHPFSFDRLPNDSAAVPDREKLETGWRVQNKTLSRANEDTSKFNLGHQGLNTDSTDKAVLACFWS